MRGALHAITNPYPEVIAMYPSNLEMARVRMEDRVRRAEHHRLLNEAKAAQRAARPERASIFAAVRRATAAPLRSAPWKRQPSTAKVSSAPVVRYV
jgi:hypothetical protein